MDTNKAKLYRRILYVGMVDIRNFSMQASGEASGQWLPKLTATELISYISGLAELLHDLGMHSARDFEDWSQWHDDFFQTCYTLFCRDFAPSKYPALVHDVIKLLKS